MSANPSGNARLDIATQPPPLLKERALGRLLSAARETTPTQSVRRSLIEPSSGL
jgi:hypothetical protein